jgi:hypothetical protein
MVATVALASRRNGPQVEEKKFDERIVHIDRVARVVKGGRRFRFRALVVVVTTRVKSVSVSPRAPMLLQPLPKLPKLPRST